VVVKSQPHSFAGTEPAASSSNPFDTLSPGNGGGSGPDYCPAPRGFGGRLPGPFDIGAGIGLAAKDPTL